ncbi:hypothetical protein QAD02_016293 [Eretmocerus hayati]|uniref:Uncharacterized protein n=1 Tax=Eretmocerus hayati TaxID=131215 RepID=A0ACC2PBY1_9HYME|nr:hypothetical protein QAD02_016293 [Eretmocerus hayati]
MERLRAIFTRLNNADIREDVYGKRNEIFLSFSGLWPYQSQLRRRLIVIVQQTLLLSMIIPTGISLIRAWGHDYEVIYTNLAMLSFMLPYAIAQLLALANVPMFEILRLETANAYHSLGNEFEKSQLLGYFRLGHLVSLAFTGKIDETVSLSREAQRAQLMRW